MSSKAATNIKASPPQRIKTAFVLSRYAAGGLERCAAHLVNRLPSDEFESSIVSFRGLEQTPDWISDANVKIWSLDKKSGNDVRAIGRLASWLRQEKIQIAHSHNWATLVETGLACRLSGTLHVHAEHSQQERMGMSVTGWKRRLHAAARRFTFKKCASVVACARTVQTGIESQWGFSQDRVAFIPNGVLQPAIDCSIDVRAELDISVDSFLVGSVGRLETLKGFDVLIAATKIMRDSGVDAHAVIVGNGPAETSLRECVEALGIQKQVHFVGYRSDVGTWMSAMDVYVNSSHTEAMSMSILEAMSCGTPVVATDVGDSQRLIESERVCGFAVPPNAPKAMANALIRYALDATLRNQHGATAKAVYQRKYSLDKMVHAYRSLYLHSLGRRLSHDDARLRDADT